MMKSIWETTGLPNWFKTPGALTNETKRTYYLTSPKGTNFVRPCTLSGKRNATVTAGVNRSDGFDSGDHGLKMAVDFATHAALHHFTIGQTAIFDS